MWVLRVSIRQEISRNNGQPEFTVLLEKYAEYGGGDLNLTPLVGDPLVDKDLTHKICMARSCAGIRKSFLHKLDRPNRRLIDVGRLRDYRTEKNLTGCVREPNYRARPT